MSPSRELVLHLDHIRASHADLVGGKMANLGKARNGLGPPTPEGFAITVEGFRLVLEEAGCAHGSRIRACSSHPAAWWRK